MLDFLAGIKTAGVWFEMTDIKALQDRCRGSCVLPRERSAEHVMEATRSCLQDTGVLVKNKKTSPSPSQLVSVMARWMLLSRHASAVIRKAYFWTPLGDVATACYSFDQVTA